MRHVILIALILFSFISCGQKKDYEIESILLDCLTQSYRDHNVDINKELYEIENYLIESKALESSSGKSYIEFYQEIVKFNDFPATMDFERFNNIFKLKPNDLYKLECLENLSDLDSTSIKNSRFLQMTIAIRNVTSDNVSPSNIAEAILSVLNASDFDHPYYRAIALLSIASSCNSGKATLMQMNSTDSFETDNCQTVLVKLTEKNQIVLNGNNSVNQDELRKVLNDFIRLNKSNHLIQFQADKETSYAFYIIIQDLITAVYSDLRNDLAIKMFNKPFNELTGNQQKEIISTFPTRMTE